MYLLFLILFITVLEVWHLRILFIVVQWIYCYYGQGLPFDRLNAHQAIDFSTAYLLSGHTHYTQHRNFGWLSECRFVINRSPTSSVRLQLTNKYNTFGPGGMTVTLGLMVLGAQVIKSG